MFYPFFPIHMNFQSIVDCRASPERTGTARISCQLGDPWKSEASNFKAPQLIILRRGDSGPSLRRTNARRGRTCTGVNVEPIDRIPRVRSMVSAAS